MIVNDVDNFNWAYHIFVFEKRDS